MITDLEYSLSQYHDGTLPPLERDALDELLARDEQARRMLAEFQRLDAELKAALPPPDDVDHDVLHARIIAALQEQEAPAVQTYALPWVSGAARWAAVAAVVLIGIGVAALLLRPADPRGSAGEAPDSVARVVGPQSQVAAAPPVGIISIGPSSALSRGGMEWSYDDAIVARPSRVIIASGGPVGQDSAGPY